MDEEKKIGFTPPKKTQRGPTRTNLEQYLALTVQMLMARTDGRDEDPYLDKLDTFHDLLTTEEVDFLNEMGKDWATHKWCEKCQAIKPNQHECANEPS